MMAAALSPREKRLLKAVERGLPPVAIAERFRTSPAAVSSALARIRRKGVAVPHAPREARGRSNTVSVPWALLALFKREAKRRGTSPRLLAGALLTEIIRGNMIADLLKARGARRA